MDNHKNPDYMLVIMKNLNLVIILYISLIMASSLSGYIYENSVYEFLAQVSYMPAAAWKIPVISCCLYASCLLIMLIKDAKGYKLVLKISFEIATGFFISCMLGFSYTGILLLIIADTMRFVPKLEQKFPFIVIICLFYFIADYDLVSSRYNLISLETYLGYYQSDIRSALLGIKNVTSSLNTFIFLIYMIMVDTIYTCH